jgi:tetratricopeptide (TPR) repeat protein
MRNRIAALLLLVLLVSAVSAQDNWRKVQSHHFTLVGNASERDLRTVGTKLEQFRSVFAQVFPQTKLDSSVPLTVIVFKNKIAYLPFMPLYNGKASDVSGYFQPGQDTHYITLTSEFGAVNPYQTIFHEFVHALTHNATTNLPLWLMEGIAEFYSMCEMSEQDTNVRLGAPISHHLLRLRETPWLPLAQLFAVKQNSPEYNERDKKSLFYAQSWALVHYLLLSNNGQRQAQFNRFLNLLSTGAPVEEGFTKAFQTDFAMLEQELKEHVRRRNYSVLHYTAKEKLTFDQALTVTPLPAAEANFYLGDMLAQQRRAEAQEYLQTALQLDPTFAAAHASLGLLRIQAGNFEAAQKSLEKAVAYDKAGKNHLIYYYYAMALLREGAGHGGPMLTASVDRQKAPLIRTNLQRAIQINPNFTESYNLLSFVNLATGEQLDESVALLKSALQFAPGDQGLAFQLAQLYLRQDKCEEAKRLLDPLVQTAAEPAMQQRAQLLLDEANRTLQSLAQYRVTAPTPPRPTLKKVSNLLGGKPRPVLRRLNEGEFVRGILTRRECSARGTTFYVTAGEQQLVFHTNQKEKLRLTNYTLDASVTAACKAFTPAQPVRVFYRGAAPAALSANGEPLAVEFFTPRR